MAQTIEQFVVKVVTQGVEQLKKLGDSADAVNAKMNNLSSTLLGVGFGAFIKGALDSADKMVDLSDATGLSIASIKAFGESMRLAGGNSKNAEKSIMALYGAIESAADGSQKTQEAFAAVKVSISDLQNLSEADILQKTIEGLAKIPAGSERAAAATALLGRSFRSVEAKRFLDTLDPAKYAEYEASAKKAADTLERFENIFATLQEGALAAFEPLAGALEGINFNAKDAERLFQLLGLALAGVFAAKTISMISDMVKVVKTLSTAIRGTVIAQTALTALAGPKGWAIIAGAVGLTAAAYVALDSAMEDANKTAAKTPTAPGKIVPTTPSTGSAGRKIKASPEAEAAAKAAAESEKRIAQSQAEFRKLTEMTNANEITKIRAGATAEIEKMEIEVRANKLLKSTQIEKEIAERRKEISKKAELDIAKIRTDIETQLAEQLKAITGATEERQKAFEIEKKFNSLGGSQLSLQQQLLDVEKKRKDARDAAIKAAEKDPGNAKLDETLKKIDENAKVEEEMANQRYQWSRDFATGWEKAFGDYIDSATNAATQAQAIFQSMTGNMNSAIDNFVETGKFSFSDFTQSVIKDILKIQLKAAAANLFSAGASAFGFPLPGKAIGGPVSPNTPYMVGERGPEAFIPATAGTIIPNNKLGGGGGGSNTYITNNISAIDSKSVAQLFAENRQTLFGNVEQARRELPMRTR
jgi:lambda family phage tail tape measure protein